MRPRGRLRGVVDPARPALAPGPARGRHADPPFGTGLDLFGTRTRTVDLRAVSPATVAAVQVNAIVLGHVAATVSAHDLALREALREPATGARPARVAQLPLVAAMVVLTCAALGLLLPG